MHVAITGGTGLVGRYLIPALLSQGHRVSVLSRSPERVTALFQGRVTAVPWPHTAPETPWTDHVATADAVVHLAGATLNRRWSPAYKEEIRRSRVETTRALVSGMQEADQPPAVLVSGSAIGYYGPTDDWVNETSPPGGDFLAEVVQAWEAEAIRANEAGTRTVLLRTGVVLSEDGGALARMLLPFRYGFGGPLGTGRQWMSWIHRDDLVALILKALEDNAAEGPLNGTAPNPVQMNELARTLGRVLRRPAMLKAPAAALRLALGEMADLVLYGQRVRPTRALELGYTYRFDKLEPALQDLVGRHG